MIRPGGSEPIAGRVAAPSDGESLLRRLLRYFLSGLFLVSGSGHFMAPAGFIAIVPASLPRADLLVAISGAAELVLAVMLFVPGLRKIAAWLLILLMFAVWPANWNMALNPTHFDVFTPVQLWTRVWLQLPMVLWALYAGGIWPRLSPVTARSESQ